MSRFMNPVYEAMEAYVPGEQPKDMAYIKLNTNESPYPPAPSVAEALTRADVEDLRLYSDPTALPLKQKLAKLYDVDTENIFLANGSDDILNFAFMAFGAKGAMYPDITYGFYPVFAQLHGIESLQVPLKPDFTVDYRDYLQGERLVVIANPNAPTGLSIPVWQIEKLLESDPYRVVVVDEAYVDFGGESAYRLIKRYDNLLVVRTYSKSRCMAGARLGYAIGPKVLVDDLEKLKYSTNPYNINRLTMLLGQKTVDEEAYYVDRCNQIIKTREYTAKELKKLGFRVLESDANFLFAESDRISGQSLYEKLKDRGILVRHFTKDRICNFNRITIGTMEQMQILVKTVDEILQEVANESQ